VVHELPIQTTIILTASFVLLIVSVSYDWTNVIKKLKMLWTRKILFYDYFQLSDKMITRCCMSLL
jgi:hypothetical protein